MPISIPLTAQSSVALSSAKADLHARALKQMGQNLPGGASVPGQGTTQIAGTTQGAALGAGQKTDQGTAQGTTRALDPKQSAKIDAAARDFEAVYLTEMMRPMLETVPVDKAFGGGRGEEVFRGMLADEYGKIMARSGGIGLASSVRDAMIRAQEAANGSTGTRGETR